MKRIVLTLLLTLSVCFVWAADNISVQQLSTKEGLDSPTINAFTKDDKGRLWIASEIGITCISNGDIKNIRNMASDGGHVIPGNVKDITYAGRLLLACNDRILDYDYNNNVAEILKFNDNLLTTDCFLQEGDQVTFYSKELNSIFCYNTESRELERIAQLSTETEWSFKKIVRTHGESNVIYLADDINGLYSLDRSSGSFQKVPGTDNRLFAKATVIDNADIIWLSVPNQGVKGYHIKSGYEQLAWYKTDNSQIPNNNVSCIVPLPDGNLITCHEEEGSFIIIRAGRWRRSTRVTEMLEEVKGVNCAMVKPEQDEILFGTHRLGLLYAKKTFITEYRDLQNEGSSLLSAELYTASYEEPEGTLILGTMVNGLCRFNPSTRDKSYIPGTEDIIAKSICRFDESRIIISTDDNRLILLNRSNGRRSLLIDLPAFAAMPQARSIQPLLTAAPNGNIFIFNNDSKHFVYRHEDETLQEFTITDLHGNPIKVVKHTCVTPYAIYITDGSSIIDVNFNTLESKTVVDSKTTQTYNITSLTANNGGDLFYSEPRGLMMYNPHSNNNELVAETWGNGRFLSVTVDNKGIVWFTTTDGYIHTYNHANREWHLYSAEDGLPKVRFHNTISTCTASGIVLFSVSEGLLLLNTNGPLLLDTPPVQVECTWAKTFKKVYTESELKASLKHPIRLPAKHREMQVEISANSFNPIYPHIIVYRAYKDDKNLGSIITSKTSLELPMLEYGTYTIVAMPAYRPGLAEQTELFKVKICRPFIGSLWGITLMFAGLMLIGWLVVLTVIRKEGMKTQKALALQDIKNREDKIAFLSNVAHELRTPLSLIYNPVKDFLQEKSMDGIDYERMERIFNQVNKMSVIVNMILDSGKKDVNKADIIVEEVNLNEWLNFLLEDYRIDCYAKGFKLKFVMDNSIGIVAIDKRIIETGLSNMVNNAIKYSIKETVITVITSRNGDMIRISVKDEGNGFDCDPEDLFKRYYRANTNSAIPGYGLGLPYSRLLLGLVGGSIAAKNNENGVGSTFYIEFPCAIDKNGKPIKGGSTATNTTVEGPAIDDDAEDKSMDFDTSNMSVMLVSSKEHELDVLQEELEPLFKQVFISSHATDAFKLLNSTDIDIIITDPDLEEGLDGFELCAKIKSTLKYSHIPVIMLASRTDERNKAVGFKMGADTFLPKPLDFGKVYPTIRRQLGGRFEIKRQYFYGFFSKISLDQTFSMADDKFISTLNQVIEENIQNPKLVEELINDKLGLSVITINRKLQILIGTNIERYVSKIRTEFAKSMLSDTQDSLEVIAWKSGFENVMEMDKTFRQETGKSVFTVREVKL